MRLPVQFIWWGWAARSWGFYRFGSRRAIYHWSLCVGPIEIRRWAR